MQAPPISEDQMQQLLEWIDAIQFSRPKKNLSRDFSDGVLVAEILKQYYPSIVQLHNYQAANSSTAKFVNWKTLNQKVFKKLNFQIHRNDIENIIMVAQGTIEKILYMILSKIKKNKEDSAFVENADEFSTNSPAKIRQNVLSQHARDMSAQLSQKQQIVKQLRGTIQMMQMKMKRMEELNKLKDVKIEYLIKKLEEGIL